MSDRRFYFHVYLGPGVCDLYGPFSDDMIQELRNALRGALFHYAYYTTTQPDELKRICKKIHTVE